MDVRISSEVVDAILAATRQSPEREVCGLLLGYGDTIFECRAAENVAETPADRFEVDPAALLAAYRAARSGGPAVLGHYHSHPRGASTPSACDAREASPDDALWLIVGAEGPRLWRAVERGQLHGRFDPVGWKSI